MSGAPKEGSALLPWSFLRKREAGAYCDPHRGRSLYLSLSGLRERHRVAQAEYLSVGRSWGFTPRKGTPPPGAWTRRSLEKPNGLVPMVELLSAHSGPQHTQILDLSHLFFLRFSSPHFAHTRPNPALREEPTKATRTDSGWTRLMRWWRLLDLCAAPGSFWLLLQTRDTSLLRRY